MLALRYLLIAGGLGMILVAVSILGYDLYRELLYRRALATPGAGTVPPLPGVALADIAGAGTSGVGTDSAGVQHCCRAERHGGNSRERNERHGAGDSVSGRAFCYAAGRGRRAVRYARSGLHHRSDRRMERTLRQTFRASHNCSTCRPRKD